MNTTPYDSLLLGRGPESPVEGYSQIRTLGDLRKRCAVWTIMAGPCICGTTAIYGNGRGKTFGLRLIEGLWVFRYCEDKAVYERIFEGLGGDYRLSLT